SCLVLLVSPLFLSGDGFVLHFFLFFFFPLARSIFYSLSLHDALPIYFNFYIFYVLFIHLWKMQIIQLKFKSIIKMTICSIIFCLDRKSTRLNSSHVSISYAVACLKKKKTENNNHTISVLQKLTPPTTY